MCVYSSVGSSTAEGRTEWPLIFLIPNREDKEFSQDGTHRYVPGEAVIMDNKLAGLLVVGKTRENVKCENKKLLRR